jgi:transcriptional regulator with XRE-family HTH domain
MEFAKLLTKYREQRGITKTDLARLLKVTPTYIMNLESGRAIPPTYERFEEIQNALGLNDNEKHNLMFALHLARAPEPLRKLLENSLYPTVIHVDSFPLFTSFPENKKSKDEDFKFIAESHIYRIHGDFLKPLAKDGQRIIVSTASYFINPSKHGSILLIQVDVTNEETAKKLREFTGNEKISADQKPFEIVARLVSENKGVMTVEHIEHNKRYLVLEDDETMTIAEILGVLF